MYNARQFKTKNGYAMPFYVLLFALMVSFKLILCGSIFVDFFHFASDKNVLIFRQNVLIYFFVLRDPGTTQTLCLDAFLPNSDSYH